MEFFFTIPVLWIYNNWGPLVQFRYLLSYTLKECSFYVGKLNECTLVNKKNVCKEGPIKKKWIEIFRLVRNAWMDPVGHFQFNSFATFSDELRRRFSNSKRSEWENKSHFHLHINWLYSVENLDEVIGLVCTHLVGYRHEFDLRFIWKKEVWMYFCLSTRNHLYSYVTWY